MFADLQDILSNVSRQRSIVSEELAEIVEKYGNERRTEITHSEHEVDIEDLGQFLERL